MTETRTTTTDDPGRDATDLPAQRSADDRAPIGERTADRSDQLSTADIAGGGASSQPTSTGTSRAAHDSNLPEPKATPLFSDDAANELRERWTDIQAGFVDEPRSSVENADALVAEVMKRLADSFATERQALEGQWSRGDDASTEDLRVALRRYRSFFDRLLSV